MRASTVVRRAAAALVAALLGTAVVACTPSAPTAEPVEMTDTRVSAGPAASCEELELSEVRCTLVMLRATRGLDDARPDHADVEARELHAAASPSPGQSPLPDSLVSPAVVVFALADGSKVGVPVLCPAEGSETDPACNPQVR